MRVVVKMASHNFERASSGASSGYMASAHAGVALATIVQLIAWRVMSSRAGL
jgi:hypothetical protein